jgi:hypothetical protein
MIECVIFILGPAYSIHRRSGILKVGPPTRTVLAVGVSRFMAALGEANPKLEIRSPKEIRNPKSEALPTAPFLG